jgi:hypothetical protein
MNLPGISRCYERCAAAQVSPQVPRLSAESQCERVFRSHLEGVIP